MTSYNTGTNANSGGASNASQALTIPAGVLANDSMWFVAAAFTISGSAATITTSSTGTSLSQVGTTQFQTNGSVSIQGSVWQATASSSDAGKVITVHSTVNAFWAVGFAAWTGASTSSPVDVAGGTSAQGTNTITCPNETTGVAGDWALYFFAGAVNDGAVLTGPSGSTSRQNLVDSSGISVGIYDSNGSVGGSGTGIGGGTFSGSAGGGYLTAFTVGLAPGGPTNVTSSFGLAMAPLAESFTASERISGSFGLGMAPLKEHFTATETGANISASFGLAMAPLAMRFAQSGHASLVVPSSDEAREFKRWLLWEV